MGWIIHDLPLVELFDVSYYHDLEMWVRDHSRSLKQVPFESSDAVSYSPSILTTALSCIVFDISDLLVENREIFIPHLYLAPPQGLIQSEFLEDF